MARIYGDTWVEKAQCFGIFATPHLNGRRFEGFAMWVDVDAGEIGAFVQSKDGGFRFDEETGEDEIAIICGKVELVGPDNAQQFFGA